VFINAASRLWPGCATLRRTSLWRDRASCTTTCLGSCTRKSSRRSGWTRCPSGARPLVVSLLLTLPPSANADAADAVAAACDDTQSRR
jgi:hypothetical protein